MEEQFLPPCHCRNKLPPKNVSQVMSIYHLMTVNVSVNDRLFTISKFLNNHNYEFIGCGAENVMLIVQI